MAFFIDFLLDNIGDNIIDISKCKDQVKIDFSIFNYFKNILDKYSNFTESK